MRTLILIATMLAGCGAPIDFPDDVPAFGRGAVVVMTRTGDPAPITLDCGPSAVTVDPDAAWEVVIADCGDDDLNVTLTVGEYANDDRVIFGKEATPDLEMGWVRYETAGQPVLIAWDVR